MFPLQPRLGPDGKPLPGSTITNVTIDKSQSGKDDTSLDDISVEDILEKQLHIKGEKSAKHHGFRPMEPIAASPRPHEEDGMVTYRSERDMTSARSGMRSRADSTRPGSQMDYNSNAPSRPMTSHSMHNMDQDLDTLVVTNSNSDGSSKPKYDTRANRAHSAKRPPPAKPSLHKSSAAMGASIGGGHKNGESSYIQITQQIVLPRETPSRIDQSPPNTGSNASAAVIQSVHEHNKADYPEEPVTPEQPIQNSIPQPRSPPPPPVVIQQVPRPTAATPPVQVAVQIVEIPDATPAPGNSPPSSIRSPSSVRSKSPEVEYAFNIPTADVAESDVYSVTDLGDGDGHSKAPSVRDQSNL